MLKEPGKYEYAGIYPNSLRLQRERYEGLVAKLTPLDDMILANQLFHTFELRVSDLGTALRTAKSPSEKLPYFRALTDVMHMKVSHDAIHTIVSIITGSAIPIPPQRSDRVLILPNSYPPDDPQRARVEMFAEKATIHTDSNLPVDYINRAWEAGVMRVLQSLEKDPKQAGYLPIKAASLDTLHITSHMFEQGERVLISQTVPVLHIEYNQRANDIRTYYPTFHPSLYVIGIHPLSPLQQRPQMAIQLFAQ